MTDDRTTDGHWMRPVLVAALCAGLPLAAAGQTAAPADPATPAAPPAATAVPDEGSGAALGGTDALDRQTRAEGAGASEAEQALRDTAEGAGGGPSGGAAGEVQDGAATPEALFAALAKYGCRVAPRDAARLLAPMGFERDFVSRTITQLVLDGRASEDAQGVIHIAESLCPPGPGGSAAGDAPSTDILDGSEGASAGAVEARGAAAPGLAPEVNGPIAGRDGANEPSLAGRTTVDKVVDVLPGGGATGQTASATATGSAPADAATAQAQPSGATAPAATAPAGDVPAAGRSAPEPATDGPSEITIPQAGQPVPDQGGQEIPADAGTSPNQVGPLDAAGAGAPVTTAPDAAGAATEIPQAGQPVPDQGGQEIPADAGTSPNQVGPLDAAGAGAAVTTAPEAAGAATDIPQAGQPVPDQGGQEIPADAGTSPNQVGPLDTAGAGAPATTAPEAAGAATDIPQAGQPVPDQGGQEVPADAGTSPNQVGPLDTAGAGAGAGPEAEAVIAAFRNAGCSLTENSLYDAFPDLSEARLMAILQPHLDDGTLTLDGETATLAPDICNPN